ncbi:MAG: RHS repeat-associated core domain-containing protein [Candidatus Diapherotrites archaeon]
MATARRLTYTWGQGLPGGIGGLLDLNQGGSHYSYLYDGKGNVTALLDENANVAATYAYGPFGEPRVPSNYLSQPMQFSTKPYDENTGLSYYGYRFYVPALGRWLTRDPLGEEGGINLYGFAENNPINWVDPFGLWTMPFPAPVPIVPPFAWPGTPANKDFTDATKRAFRRFWDDDANPDDETRRRIYDKCFRECEKHLGRDRCDQGAPFRNCMRRCMKRYGYPYP